MNNPRDTWRSAAWVLLTLVTSAASGCSPDSRPADSSGGSALESEVADWDESALGEQLWRVGQVEDGPAFEVLGRVTSGAFVGAELAVADAYASEIHLYDSTGMHTLTVGGPGRGPGELVDIRDIGGLSGGQVAVLDVGPVLSVFNGPGAAIESYRFPGRPTQMCTFPDAIVILGVQEGSDQPIHILNPTDSSWRSIGSVDLPGTNSPDRAILASSLMDGDIACAGGTIFYARSSDATVQAMDDHGSLRWTTTIPDFVGMEHEDAGERGIRHGPPEGATEVHAFGGIVPLTSVLAVQILRWDLQTNWGGLGTTLFLDISTGEILGRDDSLPTLLAADQDHIAVLEEELSPVVSVHRNAISRRR